MPSENIYGLNKGSFYKLINTFTKYSEIIDQDIFFGSRARGDYKPTSDIDLAIIFKRENEKLFHIMDELSEGTIIYTKEANKPWTSNHPTVVKWWKNFKLHPKQLGSLELDMNNAKTNDVGVKKWIKDHQSLVNSWFSGS